MGRSEARLRSGPVRNGSLPACFRTLAPQMLGGQALADVVKHIAEDVNFSLTGLSTSAAEALAHLAPYLLCGEESAVHIFYREGRRARDKANAAAQALLWQIASEEKVHEAMLGRLALALPVSDELLATRSRGHEFFVGMADPDPAIHFARVAALDSGVCKIMAALCSASAVIRCPAVHQILSKVRNDEARHVRVSRQYVADLGLSSEVLNIAAEGVCPDLVTFLCPAGKDFDNLGVDSDLLFRHVKREEVSHSR